MLFRSAAMQDAETTPTVGLQNEDKSSAKGANVSVLGPVCDVASHARDVSESRHAKRQPLVKISPLQDIGGAAAFIKRVRSWAARRVLCLRHGRAGLATLCGLADRKPFPYVQALMRDGAAIVACSGEDAIWQSVRVLRCARSMLIEVG